mmetsp:Transcript_12706/g.31005  ORF Transcript_12706/g.31005 Transcript_12706/m.31005 type:complete len:500 (+) Transcript_12706:79-1578(+)
MQFRATVKVKAVAAPLLASILWMPLTTGFMLPGALLSPTKQCLMPPSSAIVSLSSSNTIDSSQNDIMKDAPLASSTITSSLASDYGVRINPSIISENGECGELEWELHPLGRWEEPNQGEGTLALRALGATRTQPGDIADAVCTLNCQWQYLQSDPLLGLKARTWSINIASDEQGGIVTRELICVLARIMVQSAAFQIASRNVDSDTLLRITLPLIEGEGCHELLLSNLLPKNDETNASGVRLLFDPLNSQHAKSELVDMVNHDGMVLGSLPRPYVHKWNILHRGIGLIVSKDDDILEGFQSGNMPEVYVHRRTSTKRIFPSLYDMFVGGVSTCGEDARLTAAREVSEELGLRRALDILENKDEETINPLSDKLFQCTVCTSYNRCVVSMFKYTCKTELESITWQEEEVGWGDYVPYDIVKLAGDMSISRLLKDGAWPGSDCSAYNCKSAPKGEQLDTAIQKLKNKYDEDKPWESWDFVPDGLLVWEAWKSFLCKVQSK